MPWCGAVNCTNNSYVPGREKVSLFGLPHDEALKKQWLQNTKRENPTKSMKLCHRHFKDDCFKRDLQVSLIYY